MVCGCLFSRRPPRRSRRRLGRQRTAIGAERFRRGILLLRRPVLPPVHRPVFTFHHVVGFGALVLCVGGNGIIHSAHKAIQGDDCCPRQSSRSGFPDSPLSGTLLSYGASTFARTSDRGHVAEV